MTYLISYIVKYSIQWNSSSNLLFPSQKKKKKKSNNLLLIISFLMFYIYNLNATSLGPSAHVERANV